MENNISDKLRSLVSNNKFKEAIEEILKIYNDSTKRDTLYLKEGLILKQRLTHWDQQFITGQEPSQKEKADIAYSILLIADKIEFKLKTEKVFKADENEKTVHSKKGFSWEKNIITSVPLAVSIVLFTFMCFSFYYFGKQIENSEYGTKKSEQELVYSEISEILGKRICNYLGTR